MSTSKTTPGSFSVSLPLASIPVRKRYGSPAVREPVEHLATVARQRGPRLLRTRVERHSWHRSSEVNAARWGFRVGWLGVLAATALPERGI